MIAGHKKNEIKLNLKSERELIKTTLKKEMDFYKDIKRITENQIDCALGSKEDLVLGSYSEICSNNDQGIFCWEVDQKSRTTQSISALKSLHSASVQATVDLFRNFAKFIPNYHGTHKDEDRHGFGHDHPLYANQQSKAMLKNENEKEYCIILENLLFPFLDVTFSRGLEERICILDLKLGAQLHEPSALLKKKEKMYRKSMSSTSSSLSLRICGMRILGTNYSRKYCLNLTNVNFASQGLNLFFHHASADIQSSIISQIKELKGVYQDLNFRIRCYSASLLVIYNADFNLGEKYRSSFTDRKAILDNLTSVHNVQPVVRMIDFAHSSIFGEKQDLEREIDTGFIAPYDLKDHCGEDTNIVSAFNSLLDLLSLNQTVETKSSNHLN
jgi:hypothetical protein